MAILKKLLFAPFFLIAVTLLVSALEPLFNSYDFIFSLSSQTLYTLTLLAMFIFLTGFFFCLFATFAGEWKLIVPVGLAGALIPMLSLPQNMAVILFAVISVSFLVVYLNLQSSLKTYLSFHASSLIGPAIRQLATFLIIAVALVYFLSVNKMISQNGFAIPDSLIDTAMKMTPIDTEQASLTLPNAIKSSDNASPVKQIVKNQLQAVFKPYQNFIPPILALLLFLSLQSFVSILGIFLTPLLWLIFLIFEKTGFVKFEVEQRTVRKLVV